MTPILEVVNLSKKYHLGATQERTGNLRESVQRMFTAPWRATAQRRGKSQETFWALRDVSFTVPQGQVVGIIGRNGAGKSTLLKIASRITDPTSGHITLRGRMASLLEVGTGFHPELTGRENIYMNGAILGMRKAEITRKFDEIVAFAEIGKFLDTQVKHYSSGMYVRLAFSVSAHLEPEILIVDEVLAVGDMAFQKKCLGKMSEVSHDGRTVLFVSHNMAAVENLCQRGVVLEQGRVVFDGESKPAIEHYLRGMAGTRSSNNHVVDLSAAENRKATLGPLLRRIELFTDSDRPVTDGLLLGARLKLRIQFELPSPTASFNIGVGFNNASGLRVFTAHSCFEPHRPEGDSVGMQTFTCDIPSLTLVPGDYLLRLWLDIGNAKADEIFDAATITVLESDYYGTGKVPWNGTVVMRHGWALDPPVISTSGTVESGKLASR